MNRILYIAAPIVLMAVFLFLYVDSRKELERKKEQDRIEKAAADAKVLAEKEELRKRNEANALAAEARRKAEDAEKEAKKKKEFEDGLNKIRTEEANYMADLNKYKQQIADIEKELAVLRAEKEKLARQSIDMSKTIAATYIERQNAEMEVQRYAAIVARRATESPLARVPAPAAPATTQQQ